MKKSKVTLSQQKQTKGTGTEAVKTVFFGTPEFARIILEKLIASQFAPSLVVTAPDKQVGREKELTPSPVKVLAKKYKIEVLQPEKFDESTIYTLKAQSPKFFVVAAYGKLLPQPILDIPTKGTLNVHPSLLPRWRGASPIQSAILHGEKETGVTIMLMDAQLDHGPILAQSKVPLPQTATTKIFYKNLAELGAKLLIDALEKWLAEKVIPQEQNHKEATFCKVLQRKDGHIDWDMPVEYIERAIRAFDPWPGTYAIWKDKRLKILEAQVRYLWEHKEAIPGTIFIDGENFAIQTSHGALLPQKVQLEGKSPVTAQEFLRGYPDIVGSVLQ